MAFTCPIDATHGKVDVARTDHVGGATNKLFELTCGDFVFDKTAGASATAVKDGSGTQLTTSNKGTKISNVACTDAALAEFMRRFR